MEYNRITFNTMDKNVEKVKRPSRDVNLLQSQAKSLKIELEEFPPTPRALIDGLASRILDHDNPHSIITGYGCSGKSFILEQLAFNIDRYLEKTTIDKLYFILLNEIDLIELDNSDKFKEYFQTIKTELDAKDENICFVTESTNVAGFIANVLPRIKVVLEMNIDILIEVMTASSASWSQLWGSWQVTDCNQIFMSKKELIELLEISILKRLNLKFHKKLTTEQLKKFVNYGLSQMQDAEQYIDGKKVVCVPFGMWATMVRYLISNYAYASGKNMLDKNGEVNFNKVMKITFAEADSILKSFDDEEENVMTILNIPEDIINLVRGVEQGQAGLKPVRQKKSLEPLKFKEVSKLGERLSENIIGQEAAVELVSESMLIPAAGLNEPTKPLRSFFFLGPTGVGKTQLAIELANTVAEKPMNLVRIDMSEYQQSHEVAKLFGAPPGYVGHDQGGILTKAVEENPYSIVLLDEMEKAHEKVWDSFLQVLDSGRMTDSQGNVIDFTQTIVIMTSNIGVNEAKKTGIGFVTGNETTAYNNRVKNSNLVMMKELERSFRPEFLNRIDEVVVFNELTTDTAAKIVRKEIKTIVDRIADRGFTLEEVSDEIVKEILNKADISKYGAREIKRVVLRNISKPVALSIVKDDEKNLTLSLEDGVITVKTSTERDKK